MSYFKEVEFELPVDPAENARETGKELKLNKEKLDAAVDEIKQEFDKIRRGDSTLVTYAIDPGDFGFPAGNRLSMLKSNPTKENFIGFIEIAKQDLGVKAAFHFLELLNATKETNDE